MAQTRTFSASVITLAAALLLVAAAPSLAQKCGCSSSWCCSRWGYCGTGSDYYSTGCQSGPCSASSSSSGVSVRDIVTNAFFNGIADQVAGSYADKGFYTRSAFFNALGSYPNFGTVGSRDDSKREIATFFACVTHETWHMCYIEEINGPSRNYCNASNMQYTCVTGKGYYGCGPIQLSWNFNYGPAGESISFDELNHPETLANNNVISFKTGLWYWMNYCHNLIIYGQGFGATIRAINGALECDGQNPATVSARIEYYTEYCNQLGVDPRSNLEKRTWRRKI